MRRAVSGERGFTLLELMVAMTIFAVLAVAGWQVFDGVTRAREKAQYHADNLATLQYAYLQLQQDMGQIVAYQAPSNQSSDNGNRSNNPNAPAAPTIEAFMSLNGEQISFVRFADPDPRYQISPSLQRVDYIFADQRLIRRQYSTLPSSTLQNNADSVSLDTVLLDGITEGRWQAYTPELSAKYPNPQSASMNSNANSMNNKQGASENASIELLPAGVGVSFSYEDMPITWQWALAPKALPQNSKKSASPPNTNNSANNDTDNNASVNDDNVNNNDNTNNDRNNE